MRLPDGRLYTHEDLSSQWGLTFHAAVHLYMLVAFDGGIACTSGVRTVERNRAVGGSPNSYHLSGRAVDIGGSRASIRGAWRHAVSQRCSERCRGPVEALDEGDHFHGAWPDLT